MISFGRRKSDSAFIALGNVILRSSDVKTINLIGNEVVLKTVDGGTSSYNFFSSEKAVIYFNKLKEQLTGERS